MNEATVNRRWPRSVCRPQHQSHVALLDSWGLAGLARSMEARIAAEAASADHDATTRVMLEGILADEEKHLAWLEGERALLDRLGEALYFANRMGAPATLPST